MRTTSDLVLLNLLWLVCSLGVITAPAATTALAAVLIQRAHGGDHDGFARRFLTVLRQEFARSLGLFAAWAVLALVLAADVLFAASTSGPLRWGLAAVALPAVLYYVLTALTLGPVLAVTRGPLRIAAREALLLPLRHLPAALGALVVVAVLVMVMVSAPIAAFLLPASAAYVVIRLHLKGLAAITVIQKIEIAGVR